MYYEKVFRTFAEVGLQYVVIGGVAVNLHGFYRSTVDLDIVIPLTDMEIFRFIQAVRKLDFVPLMPVAIEELADPLKRQQWIEQKNMIVFSVYNPKAPVETVDLMIDSPLPVETLFQNSVLIDFHNVKILIADIPSLIQLKQATGRQRDLIDIKALTKIEELHRGKTE
ncbi:MAG TPA: hypothetical protein VJL89_03810 [Thermodesulfovibrionia bacterium]|nr:hypothetical protein [Thermodesulfovibrionia bacterium]